MLLEKCKLAYPLVVSKFIDGGLTVFKSSNQRKTDFYNDISFDLCGLNTVLWFDSICRTYSIVASTILSFLVILLWILSITPIFVW